MSNKILDLEDEKIIKECDDLILTITHSYIYIDKYENEEEEEILRIIRTDENLSLLKEELEGVCYRERVV